MLKIFVLLSFIKLFFLCKCYDFSRYPDISQARNTLHFLQSPARENLLRTESSWTWHRHGPRYWRRFRLLQNEGRGGMSLATRNPRGNDRSGRKPDTNCGEHSRNTRGSSAEWSSERNRRDLSLIGGCLIPLIGRLEERTRTSATLVSSPIYDRWRPVSMTSNIFDDRHSQPLDWQRNRTEIARRQSISSVSARCMSPDRIRIGIADGGQVMRPLFRAHRWIRTLSIPSYPYNRSNVTSYLSLR